MSYHLKIRGADHSEVMRMDLEHDDDPQALEAAAHIVSPFGHDLWRGERFIALFEASWGAHLEAEPLD